MEKTIEGLIRYFAKYPSKAGMLKHFVREVEKYSGYSDLKDYINTLPDESILPELETLIISTNETVIENNIKTIQQYFLMIEYGVIPTGEPNRGGVRESRLHLSLILGRRHETNNLGMFEEVIEMDKMLGMITQIINQMVADSRDCNILKGFGESAITMSPIEPAKLYNCYGWWASFEKVSRTMIGKQ